MRLTLETSAMMMKQFAILLTVVSAFASTTLAAGKPNFVWLISEDNSKHFLKLFDEHGVETPHIAKLAQQGLIFDHAFSNSPVCSVARTTLITGCYAPRIGTQYHRRSMMVPMPDGLRMFPAYLREAGYYTTNNRKKDYNAIEGQGVWDASSGTATWRNRQASQPFFHMQSFGTTHESSLHFSRAAMKQLTQTNLDSVFIAPYHPDTPTFRYTYARYHDRIRQVDQQIGQVVDQLETDGLLEDTFIFYFGDHGGVLPRGKGYAYESGLHVPLVVRVPANWQHLVDAQLGSRVPGFVSFIDFGPTLLNLAGVRVPPQVDGRPFLGPGISMSEVNGRDEALGYADRFDEKYDLVRTLRKGNFEYMRSYQPFNFDGLQNNYRYRMLAYAEWRSLYLTSQQLNPVQGQFFRSRAPEALYNLEDDPHETINLLENPTYAQTLEDLRQRLARRVKSMPDLSFYPESYLVEAAFDGPSRFGQAHKDDIGRLVDIADLSLIPFEMARTSIEAALNSDNRWQRYWGLIACSSHGEAAGPLIEKAKQLATADPERLVRVRAAEFLGLVQAADPNDTLMEALATATSGVEANLILNTLVLLRDGKPGYDLHVPDDFFKFSKKEMGNVSRRLEYLNRSQP